MYTTRATRFSVTLAFLLISISKTLGFMNKNACAKLCGNYMEEGSGHLDGTVFQRNCPPGQTWNRWRGCISSDDVIQPRRGLFPFLPFGRPSKPSLDGSQFQGKCPSGQMWNRWKGCTSSVIQPRSSLSNLFGGKKKPSRRPSRPLDGTVYDAPCPAGFTWNRWLGCTNRKIVPY